MDKGLLFAEAPKRLMNAPPVVTAVRFGPLILQDNILKYNSRSEKEVSNVTNKMWSDKHHMD